MLSLVFKKAARGICLAFFLFFTVYNQTTFSNEAKLTPEEITTCFTNNLLKEVQKPMAQDNKQEFLRLIARHTDYDFLTKGILRPYFIIHKEELQNQQRYKELVSKVKTIVDENYIKKACNPNVIFRVKNISFVKDNYVRVKIDAKIPDGRAFDLDYLMESDTVDKCKCKIKDLSIESVSVIKVYQDEVKAFIESKNPNHKDLVDFLNKFIKNKEKK